MPSCPLPLHSSSAELSFFGIFWQFYVFALAFGLGVASFSWAAEARTSCEDRLKKTGYVKLKSAGVHEDVAELVREIRAQVKENLGWLPQIKYTDLTEFSLLSDIRMFEPGAKTTKKNIVAFSSYQLKGTTLEMNLTRVNEEYRQNGLSELMLAELLAYHPGIDAIHVGDLQDMNEEKFSEAFEIMNCKDAMKETYSYKRYARLGFTKIVDAKCVPQKFSDFSSGGKKYKLLIDEGELSFTVHRP